MTDDRQRTSDLVELHELCARYMSYTSQFVEDRWLEVFTPDVEYSAFGTPYSLERFPALLAAAPRGQFIGNMPVVELDGDTATGVQHFVFIDQQTHAMRLGWYRDEYVRTGAGWRIRRRATTFMRKHGGFDSGDQHDPLAEEGDDSAATEGERSVESTHGKGDDSAATEGERSVESTHGKGDDSAATEGERSVESTHGKGDDSAATEGERSVESTHGNGAAQ